MRILISNDDGYFAPGLAALVRAMNGLGDITVVAPEQNQSGSSNSLTLERPLSVRRAESGFFYINGTPTDCVHIALTGLLDQQPDLIVSGINNGQNMGDDTLYSGTVAAAMEGYNFGIPSFAFSLDARLNQHFDTAERVVRNLIEQYLADPLPAPLLLNVNIPNLPFEQLRGTVCTRLGRRHPSEPVIRTVNPRGETVYWIGPAGAAREGGPGTDFHAVASGQVSVTPLQLDLTHVGRLPDLTQWLGSLA